jgi:hypothetical protein
MAAARPYRESVTKVVRHKMRDDPVLSYSTWVALVSLGYQDSNLD